MRSPLVPLTLVALVAFTALAGCTGDPAAPAATDTGTPTVTTPPTITTPPPSPPGGFPPLEPAAESFAAPAWTPGDWWRYATPEGVRTVEVARAGVPCAVGKTCLELVSTTTPEEEGPTVVSTLVDPVTLATWTPGGFEARLQFPLKPGATWGACTAGAPKALNVTGTLYPVAVPVRCQVSGGLNVTTWYAPAAKAVVLVNHTAPSGEEAPTEVLLEHGRGTPLKEERLALAPLYQKGDVWSYRYRDPALSTEPDRLLRVEVLEAGIACDAGLCHRLRATLPGVGTEERLVEARSISERGELQFPLYAGAEWFYTEADGSEMECLVGEPRALAIAETTYAPVFLIACAPEEGEWTLRYWSPEAGAVVQESRAANPDGAGERVYLTLT
ncbi:MAG TPA: hypothetical protein VNZ52_04000 [Candidatus Thermoplasmatota archaeon]|nr:hypothetical protein [Candidatus Thermoplasmatota archaeon]